MCLLPPPRQLWVLRLGPSTEATTPAPTPVHPQRQRRRMRPHPPRVHNDCRPTDPPLRPILQCQRHLLRPLGHRGEIGPGLLPPRSRPRSQGRPRERCRQGRPMAERGPPGSSLPMSPSRDSVCRRLTFQSADQQTGESQTPRLSWWRARLDGNTQRGLTGRGTCCTSFPEWRRRSSHRLKPPLPLARAGSSKEKALERVGLLLTLTASVGGRAAATARSGCQLAKRLLRRRLAAHRTKGWPLLLSRYAPAAATVAVEAAWCGGRRRAAKALLIEG
jgi:hypothetical protein